MIEVHHYHHRPPTAKTVREMELEELLKQCRPYLFKIEMSPSTSKTLRDLIDKID